MNNAWNYNWKRRDTGEYVTVISTCTDGTVTYMGGDGVSLRIKESEFLKDFEKTRENNYQKVAKQIAEACYLNRDFENLGDTILRRTTSGYYKEGVIVYFIDSGGYFETKSGYRDFGPNVPFEIMKIRQDPDHCRAMIGLRRLGSKTDQPIIEVPAYLDHLEPNDAYWLLKRYDQPY
ncbi:MAG: hypothetical protein J6I84_03245 [Bacilli bacterium]|nr:hypothetical protein [Bacilli bacterium]